MPWPKYPLIRPTSLEATLLDALDLAMDNAEWRVRNDILGVLDTLNQVARPGRALSLLH